MTAANPQFRDYLLELLAPLGPVGTKRFFSGSGLTFEDSLFGFIMGDTAYLRVDDRTRPRFAAAGAAPFAYTTKARRVTVEAYYELPAELLDAPEELIAWARDAIAVAQRVEAAKRAKQRAKAGK
ncbi:MAG: TfoX/Sxy family protein [Rhodovibrionaceae bacterium]